MPLARENYGLAQVLLLKRTPIVRRLPTCDVDVLSTHKKRNAALQRLARAHGRVRCEYQDAPHDYVQDDIRILELSKKAYFLYKQQDSSEKRKLLNFGVFELNMGGSNSHRDVSPTV